MNESEKQKTIGELKDFYKKLRRYQNRQERRARVKFSEAQDRSLNALRLELQREHGRLGEIISTYGGVGYVSHISRATGLYTRHEEFSHSLSSLEMDEGHFKALDGSIGSVNKAIGKLESDITSDIRDEQGEMPSALFDAMQFHPKVVEASKSCFTTINYREAILNAFISLIDYIKEISGLDLDGDDLMNNVFSFNYDKEQRKITKYPIICINELKNRTDRDEQQGFMFLCKGAAAFVRNPKAHKLIIQTDPLHTLEYLAFASMLLKQLDKRVQIRHKEHSS